jgi:nucleoside-diphosphate-sugar epimerase
MISRIEEDLEYIANSSLQLNKLQGRTLFISGATGLIGSLLVKALVTANRIKSLDLTVIALVRDEEKARSVFADFLDTEAPGSIGAKPLIIAVGDVTDTASLSAIDYPIDYIFHAASITASRQMVEHPVETINTSVFGTMNMLHFAVSKKATKFVYLSSMEAYGQPADGDKMISEKDLGYIDIGKVRSGYPESKRLCENLCTGFASEYGIDVVIARLAQVFGAGILKGENRVFAQFAKSAIKGENIVLHTRGLSEGNYCYTRDAVEALLFLALCGEKSEAYNVVNEDSHATIRDMAELVAKEIAGGRIKVIIDIPDDATALGYAPDVKMRLSAEKINALGWKAKIGLLESYERMIGEMNE